MVGRVQQLIGYCWRNRNTHRRPALDLRLSPIIRTSTPQPGRPTWLPWQPAASVGSVGLGIGCQGKIEMQ